MAAYPHESDAHEVLSDMIEALECFCESTEQSYGFDPDCVDFEAVDPGGYVHNAIRRVEAVFGGALPVWAPREWWSDLLHACRDRHDGRAARKLARKLIRWAEKAASKAQDGLTEADKPKRSSSPTDGQSAVQKLLRVFTDGAADNRIIRAASILESPTLTTDEKLARIDRLFPFPATASAKQLGELLGVTKQAVLKTNWWIENRKGERQNEIGRRRAEYEKRAKECNDLDGPD
jgi:hypothetical protein